MQVGNPGGPGPQAGAAPATAGFQWQKISPVAYKGKAGVLRGGKANAGIASGASYGQSAAGFQRARRGRS